MQLDYLVTPFVAWLVAGSLKFAVNTLRTRILAFGHIGYGGLPSNHSAIVASMVVLIALREGMGHPAFGVAVTLAFVVALDASSLRKQVGRQAAVLNRWRVEGDGTTLRERMGHNPLEIGAGLLTGALVAWGVYRFV